MSGAPGRLVTCVRARSRAEERWRMFGVRSFMRAADKEKHKQTTAEKQKKTVRERE